MAAASIALLTSACAGNVKMSRVPAAALEEDREVEGVIVYQPVLVKLTYTFMTRIDKDGKVTGSASEGTCAPVTQKEEVMTVADLDKPMRIRNASGAFSAAKFSVTLSNGLLTSVNAEPTQKLSDLLSATSSLVKEIGALAAPPDQSGACNAGPVLSAISRIRLPA
jgi:hypothetical protein